jgi:hypothetical protein
MLSNPIGIAAGPHGDVFVADADAFEGASGGILRIDGRTGRQVTIASGAAFVSPISLAVAADGTILVIDYASLVIVDPSTGVRAVHPWQADVVLPWAVAVVP